MFYLIKVIICWLLFTFSFLNWPIVSLNCLYFVPNNAGLFSLFLQAKAMESFANSIGRTLIMVPVSSIHYGKMVVNFCNIFNVTGILACRRIPKDLKCSNYLRPHSQKQSLCFNGLIGALGQYGPAKVKYPTGRETTFRAVESNFPLQFTARYISLIQACIKAMQDKARGGSWTVVHWRRGDQIPRRCLTRVDRSVNCEGARALTTLIRNFSSDSVVYIATNEKNSSTLSSLRRSGFSLFEDLLADLNKNVKVALSVVDVLVAEVSLMLVADTFLAWGVSEIDDVVQFERMKRGKPFCRGQMNISSIFELNWCAHRLKLLPVDERKVIFPAATPELAASRRGDHSNSSSHSLLGRNLNPLNR